MKVKDREKKKQQVENKRESKRKNHDTASNGVELVRIGGTIVLELGNERMA